MRSLLILALLLPSYALAKTEFRDVYAKENVPHGWGFKSLAERIVSLSETDYGATIDLIESEMGYNLDQAMAFHAALADVNQNIDEADAGLQTETLCADDVSVPDVLDASTDLSYAQDRLYQTSYDSFLGTIPEEDLATFREWVRFTSRGLVIRQVDYHTTYQDPEALQRLVSRLNQYCSNGGQS